jgi:hypothetical protein
MRRASRLLLSLALLVAAAALALRRRRATPNPLPQSPAPLPALPPGPRFVSVDWTLVEAIEDGARLAIRYECLPDMELDRIDVQETPTQVFVTVLMRWQPPAGGWFVSPEQRDARVELGRPLGERELIHAPSDLGGPPDLGHDQITD